MWSNSQRDLTLMSKEVQSILGSMGSLRVGNRSIWKGEKTIWNEIFYFKLFPKSHKYHI